MFWVCRFAAHRACTSVRWRALPSVAWRFCGTNCPRMQFLWLRRSESYRAGPSGTAATEQGAEAALFDACTSIRLYDRGAGSAIWKQVLRWGTIRMPCWRVHSCTPWPITHSHRTYRCMFGCLVFSSTRASRAVSEVYLRLYCQLYRAPWPNMPWPKYIYEHN